MNKKFQITITLILGGLIFASIFFIWRTSKQRELYKERILERIAEFQTKNPKLYQELIDKLNEINNSLKTNPTDYNNLVTKGVVSQNLGDDIEAEKAYKQAIEVSPQGRVPWNNLGSIYRNLGNFKKAIKMYQNLINYFPTEVDAYLKIFSIYAYDLKDKINGERFILFTYSLFNDSTGVLREIIDFYKSLEEKEKAKVYLNELIKLDQKNKDLYELELKELQ